MGKKKPFIDKKNASTYSLLHRSQRDVAQDVFAASDNAISNANGMVLWPSPNNDPKTDEVVLGATTVMQEWRQKLAEVGLLDTQDSELYMKEITGTGTFLGKTGHVENPLADPRATRKFEEETLLEVERQLDSIPLTTDFMDDDIAAALFGDDIEEFEELNDDFVLMAASEPEGKEEDAFDFDKHIQQLMEKARREQEDAPSADHTWGQRDNAFFSKLQPLREHDDEFDDDSLFNTPGVVSKLTADEERALCEKFEATLAEYDSDEIGDCDDDAEENPGIDADDEQLDGVFDDFLLDKEDDILIYGRDMSRTGGSAFHNIGRADQGPTETLQDVLAQARQVLAEPLHAPPPEDVLIDGQSYFSLKERNPWDCESILTTYSNLDNNPVIIGASRTRRRKNKNQNFVEEEDSIEVIQKIQLSSKTGLPLGVLGGFDKQDNHDATTFRSVNRGEARGKNETAEEKKARKALVKQERLVARIQKKVTRQVFSEEFEKRAPTASDDLACKTVFRF